ncbi:MAG: hypothetical protein M1151_00865 [Candidatus Thermoplasmatota archaeon]|jgi:hypothetical protein|nr:hypothetical protein [Candidatus Thermoplasmatota archaeon]
MKLSMFFGGLFYVLRGLLMIAPFLIFGYLASITHTNFGSSASSLTGAGSEPYWVLVIAAIVIAFVEEHYFRDKEYEAFGMSLAGTAIVFLMTLFAYLSYPQLIRIGAYVLIFLGFLDFLFGFEYHKPGHSGRHKRKKSTVPDAKQNVPGDPADPAEKP